MDFNKFFFGDSGDSGEDENDLREPLLPEISIDDVHDVLGEQHSGLDFKIQEAVFPEHFVIKKQQRIKRKPSVQRIGFDEVKLNLVFNHIEALTWVQDITIYVHNIYKENNSKIKKDHMSTRVIGKDTIRVEFDLNDVENMDIYELMKTKTKTKKKYKCSVAITYRNGHTYAKETREFLVLGTPPKRSSSESIDVEEAKRTKSNSFDSIDSNQSVRSVDSGVLSPGQVRVMEVSRLVADSVFTKALEVDGTFYGKKIQTPRHDIGYHFLLKNKDEKFEEGEVVGFLPAEHNDDDLLRNNDGDTDDKPKRQVVVKLNAENIEKSVLKGVISREPYIEAYCQKEENERSETIVMLGIIPVQVVGSVRENEFLYASRNRPGKAISGAHLSRKEQKDSSFIGIALSARKSKDENSIGFVEAGVSFMQEASQVLVNQRLKEMEIDMSQQIYKVKKSNKKWRKCTIAFAALFSILLALLGVFLWQYYTPGSAYRFAMCKKGQKKPLSKAWFTYIPTSNIYLEVETTGIEFEFDVLMKKTYHTDYQQIPPKQDNVTVYTTGKPRYYLNIDRCAYGNDREYLDKDTGRRIYRGPELFVIDEKCYYVFYYYDRIKRWAKYHSADWTKFRNVHCDPPSQYKMKATILTDTINSY